ncbi:MAG: thiamine phosphate synthase [Micromonosporaceae bacterium]|nr:thiamine phosphate synthase [Micromonosporaceae bacterium]
MPVVGRLHLITDHRPGREVLTVVAAGLAGGVDTVQVRVADQATDRDAYDLTVRVLALCREHQVTCLVNDRLHLALAAGADGGHVGADDLPVAAARRVLGPHAVLGATARTPAEAQQAAADGATYVGVGPVYRTSTKPGLPHPLGEDALRAVASAVTIPVIAIGGITASTIDRIRTAGAHGVAVVHAISGAADPRAAALALCRRRGEKRA